MNIPRRLGRLVNRYAVILRTTAYQITNRGLISFPRRIPYNRLDETTRKEKKPEPMKPQRKFSSPEIIPWLRPCGNDLRIPLNHENIVKVITASESTLIQIEKLKDIFTRTKLSCNFIEAYKAYKNEPTDMRQEFFNVPNKLLGEPMHSGDIQYCCDNLSGMYKYMELVVGSMYTVPSLKTFENETLFNISLGHIRKTMCEFDNMLYSSGILKMKTLRYDELPERPENNEHEACVYDFKVFRETFAFVEMLGAVFRHMRHETCV